MRKHSKFLKMSMKASAAAIAIMAAGHAAAQDATTNLAPIVVQADGQDNPKGPVKGYVAKSSATATKTGTPIVETQQSISVVTRDQIEAQSASTLGQVLGYTPGVVGEAFGVDGRFDNPLIRGFESNQSQYLNGLKLMRTFGATSTEIYGLERVEVLRGPASVLYGQGNPGGLINMVSKRPQFEPLREVGVQAGSYDTYGTFFDFSDRIGETDFAYRLTGLGRVGGQQTDDLENDRYFLAPAFTWKPDEDTTITFLSSIQHDNPDAASLLPPTRSLTGVKLPRDFSVGDPSFDKSDRTVTNIGYEIDHQFDDVWSFHQNMRYSNLSWEYQSLSYSSLAGNSINRLALYQDENLNTYNLDTRLQAEFETGRIEHDLVMGVDLRYFNNNTLTEFGSAPTLNLDNPQYGTPFPKVVTYSSDVDSRLWQTGLYVQDELKFENWRATLGLRQDWAGVDGSQNDSFNGLRSLDQTDHKLTGRAGLSYLFDNGVSPYISYATSFEPIAVLDVGGDPLKPTTGEQVEVGIKYQPTGFDGFFSIAAYDLQQKNVAVAIAGPGGTTVYEQVGGIKVRGIELEGAMSLAEGLDMRAAYTYADGEIVGDSNAGNRPARLPEHAASLWLDYTFQPDTALEGFGFGGGVRYLGQRYSDVANTFDLPSLALFDASIHYQKNNIKASLNIENIADKEYVSSCGAFGCGYGDGRTFTGKLTFTW